jgi:calcineurin-like phosphoesterase family protein
MSNRKTFVVSDTHFGHQLMANLRGFDCIDAHDRALVEAWNAVVRPEDTVWHLGDVYFRDGWKALASLNGDKRLVAGNHDAGLLHYMKLLPAFTMIGGAQTLGQNILTHIPVHPNQLMRFRLNIHGHTHGGKVLRGTDPDTRYVPVSVEQLPDFAPITLIEACNRGSP